MVSTLTIIFIITTLILTSIVPIVLAIIFHKKGFSKILVFLMGMIGFFVPQIIIRLPLLQFSSSQNWFISFSSTFIYLIVLALSAAVFESFGRLFVFKVCIPKRRSYSDGLMAGLGHGSIESIVLVGAASINNLIYSFMINAGTFNTLIDQAQNDIVKEQLYAVSSSLISTPSSHFLIGGVERVFTIIVHIGLSLLVLEGIKKNKTVTYMLITIFIHTLLDFLSVFLTVKSVSIMVIELIVFVFAIASIIYITKSKSTFSALESEIQF